MENTVILSEPIPTTIGGKLSELSVAGVINGFATVGGGFVDRYLDPVAATEFPTPSGNCNLSQVKPWAHSLHQSIQTRLEKDVLDTTPQRIAYMMCPDLTAAEFKAVRKRVYDTVVLGKGLKVDDATDDIPVASGNANVHDIEKVRANSQSISVHILNQFVPEGLINNMALHSLSIVQKMQSLRRKRSVIIYFGSKKWRCDLQQLRYCSLGEHHARRVTVSKI